MELDKHQSKVGKRMNMEEEYKETSHNEVGSGREFEDGRSRCLEFEERSKRAEERGAVLELEIANSFSDFELLEGKYVALEVEKLAIEDELRVLKQKNAELEVQILKIDIGNDVGSEGERRMETIVDLTEDNDEEDKILQLMIENKVLDCEKRKAERDVDIWMMKCKELELRVLGLEESLALRSGECASTRMMKPVLESTEMGAEAMSEPRGLNGGMDVASSLGNSQLANKIATRDEIIHGATGAGSTCYPSAKEIAVLKASGALSIDTPLKQSKQVAGGKSPIISGIELEHDTAVRKQLAFGEEGSPNKKIAPPTPCGARPASVGVIDISDNEDEPNDTLLHVPTLEIHASGLSDIALEGALGKNKVAFNNNLKRKLLDQSDEEDMDGYRSNFASVLTPKRKKASNFVVSDSENDDDDVPIYSKHTQELNTSHMSGYAETATDSRGKVRKSVARRRLVPLRQSEVKVGPEGSRSPSNLKTTEIKYQSGILANEDIEYDEMEDDGSDSEGESLGGFIVDNSDVSDGDGASDNDNSFDCDDASRELEDASESNMDLDEILSQFRRDRDHSFKWEFEADMLAAFGKDLELCMKAVCALYRQQTSEEKFCRGTIYQNQRGFSQCDALRGTALAEFLTDGDPKGDLKKSVHELKDNDPKWIELCRTLATRYSKQLFAIYKNKEDPLFLPS
ncbi:unnamed protein product [Ilex paraguariensis]|uniref:Uncharacterized protein n=1 Tax=Ilex paraguariensis TaxID=185542 RepID=A0ABC8UBJ5_9AQUA